MALSAAKLKELLNKNTSSASLAKIQRTAATITANTNKQPVSSTANPTTSVGGKNFGIDYARQVDANANKENKLGNNAVTYDENGYATVGDSRINYEVSRETKIDQYQSILDSPYRPENIQLIELNKKKDLQILPDNNPVTGRAQSANPTAYNTPTEMNTIRGITPNGAQVRAVTNSDKVGVSNKDSYGLRPLVAQEEAYNSLLDNTIASTNELKTLEDNAFEAYLQAQGRPEQVTNRIAELKKMYNDHLNSGRSASGLKNIVRELSAYGIDSRLDRSNNRRQGVFTENVNATKNYVGQLVTAKNGLQVNGVKNTMIDEARNELMQGFMQTDGYKTAQQRKAELEATIAQGNEQAATERTNITNARASFNLQQQIKAQQAATQDEDGIADDLQRFQDSDYFGAITGKYDVAAQRKLDDFVEDASEKREQEWARITRKAESSNSLAEKEEYLSREKARLDRVYGNDENGYQGELYNDLKADIDKSVGRSKEDLVSDRNIQLLQAEFNRAEKALQTGDDFDLGDIQAAEKLNYVQAFVEDDDGDPLTAVARAIDSYGKASKMETEEEKVSELALGAELDQALALFNQDPKSPDSVNPVEAYEWLLGKGVSQSAADKMLKFRGITDEILEPQITKKMEFLGFSKEEIDKYISTRRNKSASEAYLSGQMDDEAAALYLKRLTDQEEAKVEGRETGKNEVEKEDPPEPYKYQYLVDDYAERFTEKELESGRYIESYKTSSDGTQTPVYRTITGGTEVKMKALKKRRAIDLEIERNKAFAENEQFEKEIRGVVGRVQAMPEYQMLDDNDKSLIPHLVSKLAHESKIEGGDDGYKEESIANRALNFFGEDPEIGRRMAEEWRASSHDNAFITAIGVKESGGNYDATGMELTSGAFAGQKAIGKYQIMPSNWKKWAGEVLGDENAESTPENQELVASVKLQEYLEWSRKRTDNFSDAVRMAAVRWYGNNGQKLSKASDINTAKVKTVDGQTFPSPMEYANNVLAMTEKNMSARKLAQPNKAVAKTTKTEPKSNFDSVFDELYAEATKN